MIIYIIRYRGRITRNLKTSAREEKKIPYFADTMSHANYRNTCYNVYLKLVCFFLIEHEASIKDDYYRGGSAQCK